MNTQDKELIPDAFESIEAAAEFWDTHDLSDYWDETDEVELDVDLERRIVLIPLEAQVARRLRAVAKQQGISAETLVNVWLNEHLQEIVEVHCLVTRVFSCRRHRHKPSARFCHFAAGIRTQHRLM